MVNSGVHGGVQGEWLVVNWGRDIDNGKAGCGVDGKVLGRMVEWLGQKADGGVTGVGAQGLTSEGSGWMRRQGGRARMNGGVVEVGG